MSYIESAEKGLERVIVTKRRVPAAVLEPSPADAMAVERLQGFLRGSVVLARVRGSCEGPSSFLRRLISQHQSWRKPLPPTSIEKASLTPEIAFLPR